MNDMLPLSTDDFGLFQELITEASGLRFEEARSQSLQHALWQRLKHRGHPSYREYYNLLKGHPEGRLEMKELLDLITIGETYFFRNNGQFEVLIDSILPRLMERKRHSRERSIRIWSAGCSGGDEAYSIAIALMEVIPSYEEWRISILGTDINRNGLARAKEAIYGKKGVGSLPKGYLNKYFKARGSTYHLRGNVKDLVRFEYHNLAKDPFIHEGMQNLDIVFCRNVTIYFDPQTTRRVIENFYNCLDQDGYLFLGHTETLWDVTNKFERVEFPQAFIYKKALTPGREEANKALMAVLETGLKNWPSEQTTETGQCVFQREGKSGLGAESESRGGNGKQPDRKREKRGPVKTSHPQGEAGAQTAVPLFHPFTDQDKGRISAYLVEATTLANEAKYAEAADILAKIIDMDNLSVEAYYLLGVLSYQCSDLGEAEKQFRKVIYVNPDSILAYFNLGNMYFHQQRFPEAAREFRNAIQLLEKRPKDEHVAFCQDLTVEFLLRACRNSLLQISKRGERYE